MAQNSGVKGYQSMQVLSAKPERLILMLYDGAIRFASRAIKSIDESNIEATHNNLIKTQNIMVELMGSLNFDKGGEIAVNLFRIYEFMHYTLVQANVKKEREPLERIFEQLKLLRDSWYTAMKNQENQLLKSQAENSAAAKKEDPVKKRIRITG